MKNYEKLVWKLIDREISDPEFKELQTELQSSPDLRTYYQECLETESTLSSRHHSLFLDFKDKASSSDKKTIPFLGYVGWAVAAVVLFFTVFSTQLQSPVRLVSAQEPDWRGISVSEGGIMPNEMLHLQRGAIELDFPSDTKVVIEAPAYFQIHDNNSLILGKGMLTATHNGKPGTFYVRTPVGNFYDLGTQFGVYVDHSMQEASVITEVFEGNIKFESHDQKDSRFFNEGENAIIRGNSGSDSVKILANHPYARLTARPSLLSKPSKTESLQASSEIAFNDESSSDKTKRDIDAIDLMLQDNLEAQINYSLVKGIASALDQKVEILKNAKKQYTPHDGITFEEAAMNQIEALGFSISDSYVEFSKIRYWEACKTAEIIWDESKDDNGQVTHLTPRAERLAQPQEGNRLLKNLETIRDWVSSLQLIHQEKGMGWASQFGCPEDGKAIFDKRNKNLLAISYAIDSIKSNHD
jgi:hypothetical protein